MTAQRFTCEQCGIFFGRSRDYFQHQWHRHPGHVSESVKRAVEKIVEKYGDVLRKL